MPVFRSTAFGLAALAAATITGAQPTDTGAPKVRQVCVADIQKLCPDAQPGHGAIMQCMRGHFSELSPECHAAIVARRAATRAARTAEPSAPPAIAPPSLPPS